MNLKHRRSTISLFLRFAPALTLCTLFLLAGMPAAHGQVDRAVLEGTVSDPSGGVIVGCPVSRSPKYAVMPGMPNTLRYFGNGAILASTFVTPRPSVSAYSCTPNDPET